MMNKLYNLYKKLFSENTSSENEYHVINLPDMPDHKLGMSEDFCPIFFIKCCDNPKSSDIKLKNLEVKFNKECILVDDSSNTKTKESYSLISLNSYQQELQMYFIEIVNMLLLEIHGLPTIQQLNSEIFKLVELFEDSPSTSIEVIRGLWAELFVILKSNNPEYLIKSWHVSPNDKFDFNDGIDKIEVKSTSNPCHSHIFSLEQLNPGATSKLVIASVFVIQVGIGKNLLELADQIINKINDVDAKDKVRKIILKTVGSQFDKIREYYFDYSTAEDNYAIYDYSVVPKIPFDLIPKEVTQVHFRSNLTNVPQLAKEKYIGKLHNSL